MDIQELFLVRQRPKKASLQRKKYKVAIQRGTEMRDGESPDSVLSFICIPDFFFFRRHFSLVINPIFLRKLLQADFCYLKSNGLTNMLGVGWWGRCYLNKSKYNGLIVRVTAATLRNIARQWL